LSAAPSRNLVSIGPSVLSADFLRLGEQLREFEVAGVEYVHFDVMDGRFVPNISIGIPVLEATRRGTTLPIDVHLMVTEPERWIQPFRDAGADSITFHVEAALHSHSVAQAIAASGAEVGVAINPGTPLSAIEELIPFVDQILVMTVNPGFGGQSFIESVLSKVERLRTLLDERNPDVVIQVDGGINEETIASAVKAGASRIVAGTALLNDDRSVADNVRDLRLAVSS